MGKFINLENGTFINIENISSIEHDEFNHRFNITDKYGNLRALGTVDGLMVLQLWAHYKNEFLQGDSAHE